MCSCSINIVNTFQKKSQRGIYTSCSFQCFSRQTNYVAEFIWEEQPVVCPGNAPAHPPGLWGLGTPFQSAQDQPHTARGSPRTFLSPLPLLNTVCCCHGCKYPDTGCKTEATPLIFTNDKNKIYSWSWVLVTYFNLLNFMQVQIDAFNGIFN